MKRNFEEEIVKGSELNRYLKEIGYSEEQAFAFCLMTVDDDYGGGFDVRKFRQIAIETYEKEGERKGISFSKFLFANYKEILKKSVEKQRQSMRERGRPMPAMLGGARLVTGMPAPGAGFAMRAGAAPQIMATPAVMEDGLAYEEECAAVSIDDIRTDTYEQIEEKDKRNVMASPTSTFRTTCNMAAAAILKGNAKRGYIRQSMVRTEELLNALTYELRKPEDRAFEVTREFKEHDGKMMMFLGIQGKKTLPKHQNICMLIDTSGSMASKMEATIASVATILSKMNDGDLFSLVTYSDEDHVVIRGLKLEKPQSTEAIIRYLFEYYIIEGSTNGSAGIDKSYEIIGKAMTEGVNRVIIVTDGDLNFGIHDKDGLIGQISRKKETGAYFSAIGTGLYNLQDDKLEALAKNGNGNYFVVNDLDDVEKYVLNNYEALVFPIAKNVKAQVEFNPNRVKSYKLIGFENRMLNHEDFKNDKVVAEPFGSGAWCVALYELEMADGAAKSDLKYQTAIVSDSDEVATLSVRYENVDSNQVEQLDFPVLGMESATDNIEKAIACADIARKLRDGETDAVLFDQLRKMLSR